MKKPSIVYGPETLRFSFVFRLAQAEVRCTIEPEKKFPFLIFKQK